MPQSVTRDYKTIAKQTEYKDDGVTQWRSKHEKAVDMFVTREIRDRLQMLHRHSLVPARLVKYRQNELQKVPKDLRNYYKKEVKLIYLQNRMLINLFNK